MSSPSPVAQLNRDVEDDDVFMQLELPLEVIFSPSHIKEPQPLLSNQSCAKSTLNWNGSNVKY